MTSRQIELLDALRELHVESAHLSELMAALAADDPTSKQYSDLVEKARVADDRARELSEELRALEGPLKED